MKPWLPDANDMWGDDSSDMSKVIASLIPLQKESVRDFLTEPASLDKTILVGPKGTGKSLLLAAKSFLLRTSTAQNHQSHRFFPTELLVERLHGDSFLIEVIDKNVPYWSNDGRWRDVWTLAIEAAACDAWELFSDWTDKHVSLFREYIPPMYQMKNGKRVKVFTLGDYLAQIAMNWHIEEHRAAMINIQREVIRPALRAYNAPMCFFVDNPDEILDTANTFGSATEFKPWLCIQLGLLYAIRRLQEVKRNLYVFTGLRSEIYNAARLTAQADGEHSPTAQMFQQASAKCLHLSYTENELRNIFRLNCANDPGKWLKADEADPIARFLGQTKADHPFVKGESDVAVQEDAFSAILRHTMFTPRDLMDMGGAIAAISITSRTELAIRETVNARSTVLFDYYCVQVSPKWDRNYEKILEYVDSNVISRRALDAARTKFKRMVPGLRYCPFYYFYAHGLLGVISIGSKTQSFITDPIARGILTGSLPASDWYYFHPILTGLISHMQGAKYRRSEKVITGYGCAIGDPSAPIVSINCSSDAVAISYQGSDVFPTPSTGSRGQPTVPMRLCVVLAKAVFSKGNQSVSDQDLLAAEVGLIASGAWQENLSIATAINEKNTNQSKQINRAFRQFGIERAVAKSGKKPKWTWHVCKPEEIIFI